MRQQIRFALFALVVALAFSYSGRPALAQPQLVGVADRENGCVPGWKGPVEGTILTYDALSGGEFLGTQGAKNIYRAESDGPFDQAIIAEETKLAVDIGDKITLMVWEGCRAGVGRPRPSVFTVISSEENTLSLSPWPEGNWEVGVKIALEK